MLAGPTDFAEVHTYPLGRVLYPPEPCPYRSCYSEIGFNDCGGCMHYFQPHTVAAVVRELLGEERRSRFENVGVVGEI